MRLYLAFLSLLLFSCAPATQKYHEEKVNEAKVLFDAIGGDGDYKTRYERIYAASPSRLCRAALPLQSLGGTFVAMREPGVIRWKHGGFSSILGYEENGGLGYERLSLLLENETIECTKANNRTSLYPPDFPSADHECGIKAVKTVCGEDFVTYGTYERLRDYAAEYREFRGKLLSKGMPRRDNEIRCRSYSIGNTVTTNCD